MMGGFTAPDRRIGIFLSSNGAAHLTADGLTLVENAFLFAVNCPTSGQTSNTLEIPVEDVLNMTAQRELNEVTINWANNTGYKNANFVVQRSTNGTDFENIAIVSNELEDESLAFYVWTDENPVKGENLYRIQAMFKDAQGWIYSQERQVMFEDIFDFQLFPNPTMDYVDINLEQVAGNEVTITIVNQLGQTLQQEVLTPNRDIHRIQLTDAIHEGQYIVWITSDGSRQVAKSLIVMKR